jgi:photosystem II stability/assembly factor-like uncharacterized protein
MNFRFILICSAVALLSLGNAYAHKPMHVPHDIIYSLDVSPTFSEDGLVFSSSTQFGEAHLMSSNYGETFSESHAGMQRTLVTGHTFSPNYAEDGTVYMVTKAGYYKSTDRGKNWSKQEYFAHEEILSICIAEEYDTSKDIYVMTKTDLHRVSGMAVTSETGGKPVAVLPVKVFAKATFGKLQLAGGKLFVHRVSYDTPKKKNGMELVDYATGRVDVLNIATGKWSPLTKNFESAVIADVDIAQQGSAIIVSLKDGTVHRSDDNGMSWCQIFKRKDDFICRLKFSPNYEDDSTIACGSAKGFMFLSQDRGEKWETRSNGLSRWVHHVNILINRLVFSPNYKNDKTIFLGKTTGFYKTTDNGKFWRHINVWNPKWGYFVYPAPGKDPQDVFTATYNSGISRSHDLGATWSSANIGIASAFANGMELSPNYENDNTIFVLDIATGLYRSADAGRSWSRVKEVDTAKVVGKPVLYRKLGVSPEFGDDGLMFLFSVPRKILGVTEKHVWKFNDKTKELKQVSIGRDNNYINGFSFSPKGSKQKLVFAATAQGPFVSKDEGDSWQQISNYGAQKLLVSPDLDRDGLIYLMDKRGRMQVSTDFGQSFKPTELNLDGRYIDNLTFSPNYANDQTLFVTTFGEGVLRSQDAGETWSYFGLKGKLLFSGPTFSTNFATNRTMFAPAVDGIYRSTDDGATWKNVLQKTQLLPKVPLLTLKDATGREIPLTFGAAEEMKRYNAYDEEIGEEMFLKPKNAIQKIKSSKAYLASYYKFRVEADYAVEIYFYGTGIEYKCVQGNDLGIVSIVLDDKPQGQFDLYNESEAFDVTGFARDDLKKGFHKLQIIATGKKNETSTGSAMTFNAANITN